MKTLFSILLIACCSLKSYSQLSKAETLRYLSTKLGEAKSLSIHYNAERLYSISNTSVTESSQYPGKIAFTYTRTFVDGAVDQLENIFDPLHIKSFGEFNKTYDDAVRLLQVNLLGPTFIIKQTTNGKVRYLDQSTFLFPFLNTDPLNQQRLEKALLHLQKLCKDAKPLDPFLN